MPPPGEVPPGPQGFALALFQSTGVKFHPGARVRVIYNGAIFDELEAALRGAQKSINIVLYIWRPGEPSSHIIPILAERTRAGVTCRVMVDPVGSTPAFTKEILPRLQAARCDVRPFRPMHVSGAVGASLARNHRKIVVVDGRVGFTGGFGIYKDWLGNGHSREEWRDTAIRVDGPVVEDFEVAFAENWQEAGGPLLPAEDFPPLNPQGRSLAAFVASSVQVGPSNADRMTQLAIASAHRRLWIANAYFVPPEGLLDLLARKVREGVDVRILTTGPIHDVPSIRSGQRESYRKLLQAGVHIWEYQPSMMHAKTMVVDDLLSVVGSMNLDPLSLNKLEEGSLVTLDSEINQDLALRFEEDLRDSKEMNLHSPELPGLWGKISRSIFRWIGNAPGR